MPQNNQIEVPGKKQALNNLKMEVASELGVDINKGENITAKEAGLVGGHMVKRMIERAERGL